MPIADERGERVGLRRRVERLLRRDVHPLAAARPEAVLAREQRAERRLGAGEEPGLLDAAHADRRPIGVAGHEEEAAGRARA